MNQYNRKQFLAELGNIFIQFQIEMMQRAKTVTLAAAEHEEVTAKNGASAQTADTTNSTTRNKTKSKG